MEPDPPHPGDVLRTEFLAPMGVAERAFGIRLGIERAELKALFERRVGMTPPLAAQRALECDTTAEFWLGLQCVWDRWYAAHHPPTPRNQA
jgi:addiction module HigA family antidote